MKSIIFICILVPLCYAQRGPSSNILNQATQAIKTAKSNVDSATSDIKRTSRTFKMNTDNELSNLNTQSFLAISDIETRRINDIKKQVEDAKAAGKDAVDCLNAVINKMRSETQSGYGKLKQCRAQGDQLVAQTMAQFDSATITGQQLKNKLDGLALQCYTSDIYQMANCIFMNLATINLSVREYQNTAKQLERDSQSNKNNIVYQIRSCNDQAVSAVRSASINTIYEAADCLKK